MRILVLNAGSSSLKLSVVSPDGQVSAAATVQRWEGRTDPEPLRQLLAQADRIDAVGIRVVHGGPEHTTAARVDAELLTYLESITDLAPLHNPRAIAAMQVVSELLPQVPAVACFDTAFHATLPEAARTYALPREWNDRWGLRRYGFHGLSHAYATRRAAELVGEKASHRRIVSCHLGAGASLAAVRDGVCLDTTMGFTPLAGLVMATRSGDVDPGLLLWVLQHGKVTVEELNQVLEHESGLRGLSGTSGDLRDVLSGAAAGDRNCAQAFDVFVHRLTREIAAMTAAVGGLDVLVMTGGIGEHAPLVRAEVARRLAYLGVDIEPALNETVTGDAEISRASAAVRTLVVTAQEDVEIARQVAVVLAPSGALARSAASPP